MSLFVFPNNKTLSASFQPIAKAVVMKLKTYECHCHPFSENAENHCSYRNAFYQCRTTTDIMVDSRVKQKKNLCNSGLQKEIFFQSSCIRILLSVPEQKPAMHRIKSQKGERNTQQTNDARNQSNKNKAFLNQHVVRSKDKVLVEREINTNLYEGYTANYTPVQFHSDKKSVRPTCCSTHYKKQTKNDCYGIPTTA